MSEEEKDSAETGANSVKISTVMVAVASFVAGTPNMLWSLLNITTIIAFLPLMNINAPEFVNLF